MQVAQDATSSRRRFLASCTAVAAAGIAGCTSDDSGGDQGSITISGSSTVYPVTTAMQELYNDENPDVEISVSRDGTSGGFENAFIPGNSDINNASRPITEEERQQCQENGFEPVEFLVARDALTVIVNNDNDWIEDGCMTLETLGTIWSQDGPDTWSDGDGDWPDEELELYGPATTSGTYDYFVNNVVDGEIRSDFEGTEDDDLIAQGVAGATGGLGYLPFSYYTNNREETTALALDEGSGCVEPSLDTAQSGDYGLARPLFIYVNSEALESKPFVRDFVTFYLENATDQSLLGEQIGYVPISEERAQDSIETVEEHQ